MGDSMLDAVLTFSIHRIEAVQYKIQLSYEAPDLSKLLSSEGHIFLDYKALLNKSGDVDEYGRELTKQVFADQSIREFWRLIEGARLTSANILHLRFILDRKDHELQQVRWEALRDPDSSNDVALGLTQHVLIARHLDGFRPLQRIVNQYRRTAVIAVANPSNLKEYGLEPIDVEGEVFRATKSLAGYSVRVVNERRRFVTWTNITTELNSGPAVLFLICHGRLVEGRPHLCLEDDEGKINWVGAEQFAQTFRGLREKPPLVVLGSCYSAELLAALGPELSHTRVAAVVGFQNLLSSRVLHRQVSVLFQHVLRNGQIDLALATARNEVRESGEWWQPVLWTLVPDGRLWNELAIEELYVPETGHAVGEDASTEVTAAAPVANLTFKEQPIYQELRELVAQRTARLVFICGTALSAETGMPTWRRLQEELVDRLRVGPEIEAPERFRRRNNEVRSLENEPNCWLAFKRMYRLGFFDMQAAVRQIFGATLRARIPRPYELIWRLGATYGVINLGLHRLPSLALANERPGQRDHTFNSRSVEGVSRILQTPQPFIYNAHGVLDVAASWAFSLDDITSLAARLDLIEFLRKLFATTRVVLVGITPEEMSEDSLLYRLSTSLDPEAPLNFSNHYWLRDRTEDTNNSWAGRTRIKTVSYTNNTELEALLEDLCSYTSPEESDFEPVAPGVSFRDEGGLADPDELTQENAEVIRMKLNVRAEEILAQKDYIEKYEHFLEEYDEAIYKAWFVRKNPMGYQMLGYTLESEPRGGAFGKIYRARDRDGKIVALKLLRDDVRRNNEMLQAFRRGVRAMRILKEDGVEGIVAYKKAFEIPACLVMDWIEGQNLRDAVTGKKQFQDWQDILRLSVELSDIIYRAHQASKQVFHRDLRPENIMIREDWSSGEYEWDVQVLDFDLSWHFGAQQLSVQLDSKSGYHAPEQVNPRPDVSTRSSLVDSFGLGMVLYFVLTGADPSVLEHGESGWPMKVKQGLARRPCSQWRSLPHRIARLILACTRDIQATRPDVAEINNELRLLQEAFNDADHEATDLVVEELAARCDYFKDYEWDERQYVATVKRTAGLEVRLTGNELSQQIMLSVRRDRPEYMSYAAAAEQYNGMLQGVISNLQAGSWQIDSSSRASNAGLTVQAILPVDKARENLDRSALHLRRALEKVE